MPAAKIRNEIKFEPEFKSKALKNIYFSIGLDNVFNQKNIDSTFETPTSGYTLIDATAGTTLKLGRSSFRLYVSGNNLSNKTYFEHLNRLKYSGISNQGRNISFGMQLPLKF